MAIFFVDYENVHQHGLNGIERLRRKDRVFIFCNAQQHPEINQPVIDGQGRARIAVIEATTGSFNALDYQLVAKMFSKIRPGSKFFVVSRDRGYRSVFGIAELMGACVELVPSIDDGLATIEHGGLDHTKYSRGLGDCADKIKMGIFSKTAIKPGTVQSIYMIDIESLRLDGLQGLHSLRESDFVYIIYAQMRWPHLEKELKECFHKYSAQIHFFGVESGTEKAVVFQIIALIYAMAGPRRHFHIVTGDRDYKPVLEPARRLGSTIELTTSISEIRDCDSEKGGCENG